MFLSLVIEFYGDYWHCNPNLYKPDDVIRNTTVKDVWLNDKLRESIIKSKLNPKHFYTVWESDYNKMLEVITSEINNERPLE